MDSTRLDSELLNKMASLDVWDTAQKIEETDSSSSKNIPITTDRILRKRLPSTIISKRRVTSKPIKRTNDLTTDTIKKYYCNQNVKAKSRTLETIFEEPKTVSNGSAVLIGIKKIKRSLTFPSGSTHNKDKIKKRRSKIKRLLGNKYFSNRKKLTMQTFLKNLQGLDLDETDTTSNKAISNPHPDT